MFNQEMSQCIENCSNCHQVCLKTAMNHCLQVGGEHVAPDHFKLMMDSQKFAPPQLLFN